MKDAGLKIGEKIDIFLGKGPYYRTVIDDFDFSNDTLHVPLPSHRGISIILRLGQRVQLFFYRENGRFAVDSEVVALDIEAEIKMVLLRVTSEPMRQQRRESFRVNTFLKAVLRPLALGPFPKVSDPSEENEMEEVPLANLSATGAAVRTHGDYYVGERVYLRMFLAWPQPNSPPIEVLTEVRQISRVEPGRDFFQLGLKFLKISDEVSAHVAKFVLMEEQRKAKQKKLIEDE